MLPSQNVSASPLGRHFNGVFIFVYNNAKNKGEKAEKSDHLITHSGHSFISWLHLTGNGWVCGKDQGKCGPWNILKNLIIRDMKITTTYPLVVKVGRERVGLRYLIPNISGRD